jgi:hypothetical protein
MMFSGLRIELIGVANVSSHLLSRLDQKSVQGGRNYAEALDLFQDGHRFGWTAGRQQGARIGRGEYAIRWRRLKCPFEQGQSIQNLSTLSQDDPQIMTGAGRDGIEIHQPTIQFLGFIQATGFVSGGRFGK